MGEPRTGFICRTVPGHARVLLDGGGHIDAVLPRKVGVPGDERSPAAVGDRIDLDETPEGPVVGRVHARSSVLARRASGTRPVRQVICANARLMVCVMAAARPEPKWAMLDRYLIIAHSAGLEPFIVVSKMDLASTETHAAIERYRALGYRIAPVGVTSGSGLDAVRAALSNEHSVIVGKSGVGKSTLLNALVGHEAMEVGDVSDANTKGRHTTTLAVLHTLGSGWVIDTPGVREIAPWGVEPGDVCGYFREMLPHLDDCRFAGGCTHTHEVGCGVKAALGRGEIHEERYASYLRLMEGGLSEAQ